MTKPAKKPAKAAAKSAPRSGGSSKTLNSLLAKPVGTTKTTGGRSAHGSKQWDIR